MLRIGLPLLLANYVAFGLFIAARPPVAHHLLERDAALERGQLSISSADPYTYIAARPLYSWSEWHGGERPGVKLLEVANLPALVAAAALTPVVGLQIGASVYYGWSYVRAVLFVTFATMQWLVLGAIIARVASTPKTAA